MSGENSRVKAVWVLPEATFGVIADATGATAQWLPAELDDAFFAKNMQATIPRHFATARNKETPVRPGVGKGELTLKPYGTGYTQSVVISGNPAPAVQWFDTILASVFGAPLTHSANTVGNAATTTSVPSTGTYAVGELIPIRGASTNGGYVQWARVGSPASTPYPVSPALAFAPANTDVIAASRTYYPKVTTNANALIGAYFTSIVDEDGIQYAVPGCRASKLALKATAGQTVMWALSIMGDSRVRQTFASLPAPSTTDPTPMIQRLAPVSIAGVLYDVASIELDFGLTVTEIRGVQGANGRAGWRVEMTRPRLKIDPLNATAFEDTFAAGTLVEVLAQFGDGALNAGALNSIAFHCEQAQIVEVPNEANDGGIMRKPLVLAPVDAGPTGVNAFYWQLGVC